MTNREIVSQLRSSFKLLSSDNLASDRACLGELKNAAFLLIKQQTDKRKLMGSDTLFTQIDCLEMERVPLAECCSYTSPCEIGKSKIKIPKIAENIYGPVIQGVYSIDKKVRFDFMDPNRYVNYLHLYPKSQQKDKFFWVRNEHLYVTDPNIEMVAISAFFEDDIDTSVYGCDCESVKCPQNPLDAEFKCPGFLLNNVLTIARDSILKTYKRSTPDNSENNLDEST